jgi:DNA-binding response OmpR family regulator
MSARKTRTILMIDDDATLAGFLAKYLKNHGYELIHAGQAEDGMRKILAHRPVAILLDINLPGTSGLELCRKIRERDSVPIVMISSLAESTDQVVGLELGADHYLPKPFEPRVLVAHLESVLRRAEGKVARSLSEPLEHDGLLIDPSRRQVTLDGKTLEISSAEFDLLCLFAGQPGHVFNRDEILDRLKGVEWEAYNRSIDILVSRLRKKLGDDKKNPRFLKTIWGSGYVFLPPLASTRKAS